MAVNSLFTVHAVDYTASTGAQEAAQSTRATHLGAQDWLTLVSFVQPDLIFPLNCKFNFQVWLR